MKKSIIVVVLALSVVPLIAQQTARSCQNVPGYQELNFWVGDWEVVDAEGVVQGSNVIEKTLDGCAVMEHWTGAEGSQGKSLFYYDNHLETWKQVWITDAAAMPGGMKEKTLVERLEGGAVRFQGTIRLEGRGSYLDRTTLTPLVDGRVRQTIESSRDFGNTWQTGFDAIYVRRAISEAGSELAAMYAEDQAPRIRPSPDTDMKAVNAKNAEYRTRVEVMLAKGLLETAEDFYHAAMIYQHSDEMDDYLRAHALAMIAGYRGHDDGKWLAAASLDRFLMRIDREQVFGTQFERDEEGIWHAGHRDAVLVDNLRDEFRLVSIESLEERAASFNKQ